MAHTVDAPASTGAEWVRCRARVWQVLGVRHDAGTVQWQLSSGDDLPRLIAAPPDDVTPVRAAVQPASRAGWARRVRALLAAHPPFWWPRHASALAIDRLPFQFVPAMLMLSGHHRRLLVADEVGTGKTIEAALLLREVHAREPTASSLIVTPAALVGQWCRELRRHAGLDPTVVDADLLRAESPRAPRDVRASRAGGCFVTSIDLARQPEITALFTSVAWTLLVVDEAHHAAPGTARLAAVSRLAASSVRLLLLTATPTAAGLAGAAALRAIGSRPGERAMSVLCRHRHAEARTPRRTHVLHVRSSRTDATLHARLDRFVARARAERGVDGLLPALVLRRRAASCPAALIRSLERRLDVLEVDQRPLPPPLLPFDVETSTDVDAADDELMRVRAWNDLRMERTELERLLALARDCPPAGHKGAVIDKFLSRCREPAVVFTAYVDTLRQLRTALQHHAVAIIHGHTPEALRATVVDAFTTGTCAVLLTTDASAEGLNLHDRCRLVIHADVPSTPRLFHQRTGRVDRYGQTRRVHVVVMATRSTHDAESLQRLQMRQTADDHWRATVASDRCRRTMLAARRLRIEVESAGGIDEAPPVHHRIGPARAAPTIVYHRTTSRRWMRVAGPLRLPRTASRLIVGVLRAGSDALLTQTDHVVAAVSGGPQPRDAMHGWPSSCCPRPPAQRARRLVRRLVAWEMDAARAVHASAEYSHHEGLFSDAEPSDQRRGQVPTLSATPAMALSVAAVLERTS
ncbi:MAG TPA: DEAD/DEAH box helicase [Luteitalea sp.]|nr:DEAD/DEAH box helicase [Luteitalea sp.]